jgi:hypothetical protein
MTRRTSSASINRYQQDRPTMKHDVSWVPPTLRDQRDHAASHSQLLDRLGPADHPPGSPIRGGLRSLRTKLPSVRRHQRKAMAHATGRYPCAVLVAAGLAAALPARGPHRTTGSVCPEPRSVRAPHRCRPLFGILAIGGLCPRMERSRGSGGVRSGPARRWIASLTHILRAGTFRAMQESMTRRVLS